MDSLCRVGHRHVDTRSGKIMRRLLRDVAGNREMGEVTTLTDSSVMDLIKEKLPPAPRED
jgi:acetyl-CoA synthetase